MSFLPNSLKMNKSVQRIYGKYGHDILYRLKEQRLRTQIEQQLEKKKLSVDIKDLRSSTLNYIESMRLANEPYGRFRHSESVKEATLYASVCAALTRHIYGDLDIISPEQKKQWIDYILIHQADDGLFKDKYIANSMAEEGDGWGWRHLTVHAIMALTALGSVAPKSFQPLDKFKDPHFLIKWLENRIVERDLEWDLGNQVQNYVVMLQYARDFQGEEWAGPVVEMILDWLDEAQNPTTGLWNKGPRNPALLCRDVRVAYHLWLLYFYEGRPIKYADRVIHTCLSTQNEMGGFDVRINSSACADIDSIDPLVRLSFHTQYRHDDVISSLQRAIPWVLANMNDDGGFVFTRGEDLTVGHKSMYSGIDESNMFYTWFRTLSLAYLAQTFPNSTIGRFPWQFIRCPGHQFWP